MKTQRSIFLLLLCYLIVQSLATKRFLKFNEDGEFKIAQFTDLHFGVDRYDVKTIGVQRILLDLEQPDFVALTGDTITGRYSDTVEKGKKAWNKAVEEMSKRDIPWGFTFGNHEAEGKLKRKNIMDIDRTYSFSQSKFGPEDIFGVSNYHIEIHTADSTPDNKEVAVVLYFLDSGDKDCMGVFGYGCVQPNQIDWFNEVSSEFSREYPNHMGIVLFHIPLPEMLEFWHTDISFGTQEEIVCCPQNNTGLYPAMVDNGNIKLVLNGHDHINDYCTRSKSRAPDLWMCYGRKTGYGYYNPVPPMYHGARIIQLFNNQTTGTTFNTWIRDRKRRKIFQHLHKPDCILDEQCVLPKV
ncbi:hypothetical protein M0812_25157 [Anaeramoeba flamelloides]|uniref:Calcineurin-like phosphoesterase domain-containing protein n=1 Tax=Anaeramoeba flamelloides TaxID=1746091 RepID=A0AAV7YPD4_9EUKA|nr:hypothetical protein M0812_25157 [Anaeramoeba flamelloides]